jgi:minor histocompatibility antigen H13
MMSSDERERGAGSFLNGVILLSGLFVYDVFWVFGTDVMVTVAKSFQARLCLPFSLSLSESIIFSPL